jgi:DNA-binding winged helix-turn-helix (wHTH) protein/TolB-like protein/Tfp pilus assembly protein PilF
MKLNGTRVYRFDQYILEVAEHRLKRGEMEISLQPKAFETLVYLVERHDHLVTKNELLDAVWGDVAVTEGALTLRIKEVRQALGDDAQRPRYIKTIPTVGYKFIAVVTESPQTDETRKSDAGDKREQSREQDQLVAAKTSRQPSFRSGRAAFLALAGVGALLGLAFGIYDLRPDRTAIVPIKSIAVVPFKPLVAEARNEALEIGMAESLITRLGNIRHVIVKPLSAVRKYTTLEQDAVAAGREQGVDAVVDGSIQKSGERIRVMVRLTTVEDGKQLWTDQFDETFTNVFNVQDLISQRVVDALALELTGEERTLLTKHSTQNNEAYDAYLWGRHFWAQDTEEGLVKGIAYFHRALAKDPDYALAYAGLADSYILLGSYGLNPSEDSYRKAKDAAAQALTIDERLGEAHVSMGRILADHYWQWAQAERHYKRAIELIPNDEGAHNWYSQYLSRTGRIDDAIREAKLALEIAPTSRQGNHAVAFALYFARRYEEAIEQSEKTLELDPNFPVGYALIGMAYLQADMHEKAISSLRKARQLFNSPGFLGLLGYAYAMAGKTNEARSVLEELRELSKTRYVPSFSVAMIYIGLGERKLAFEWLERAVKERDEWLGSLKVDPIFDAVRSDPRFTHLLRQVDGLH